MTNNKLYTTKEISMIFNISTSWLRKLRSNRSGPKYVKLGRSVRYYQADVEKWLEQAAEVIEPERGIV